MPLKQKIAVIIMILLFIMFVFNLVRTRKLREAYSIFWLVAGFIMLILVIRYDWLIAITNLMGIVLPTSTIFLLGIMVILAVEVQVAGVLTQNHNSIQKLIQEMGLLNQELRSLRDRIEQKADPIPTDNASIENPDDTIM
jgi:hypothetical protein